MHFYPLGYPLGRSLRHILDKITKGHFYSTSNEDIWPKKKLNYVQGLKSAILTIFQKLAYGLDWPCPISVAFKKPSVELKNSFCLCSYESLKGLDD